MKVVNKSSMVLLAQVTNLNPHIEKMNNEGWELLSVAQQEIGIQEYLILFWKKTVDG